MHTTSYNARQVPRYFVGSQSMLVTLAIWGALGVGCAWALAKSADTFARGQLTSDGAIAHARSMAGPGAVACGVAPYERPAPVIDCARRSQQEGRRYWFLVSRYWGETLSLYGLARNPNGKTYEIAYSRDVTGGDNDTDL